MSIKRKQKKIEIKNSMKILSFAVPAVMGKLICTQQVQMLQWK